MTVDDASGTTGSKGGSWDGPTIDYWFTVQSPFAYLAGARLETIAARRGAAIHYRPMPIFDVFQATGGVPPKDRHPSRQSYRLQDLERSAARAGLPITLKPRHWPTDERPASLTLIAAQAAGFAVGPAVVAILRALWAEERDIADPATLSEIIAENGVLEAALAEHWPAAEATFAAAGEAAVAAGVFGSPFYVVGEQRFWGHDRLDHLDDHLAALTSGG